MGSPTKSQFKDLVLSYACCTLYLACLFSFTKMSAINEEKRPSEDTSVLQPAKAMLDKLTPEDKLRRERVLGNNMENIPLALIVFWAAFVLQYSLNYQDVDTNNKTTVGLTALIVMYTVLRTVHNVSYMYAIQPLRSIAFLLGEFTFLATCAMLVYLATQFDFDNFPLY